MCGLGLQTPLKPRRRNPKCPREQGKGGWPLPAPAQCPGIPRSAPPLFRGLFYRARMEEAGANPLPQQMERLGGEMAACRLRVCLFSTQPTFSNFSTCSIQRFLKPLGVGVPHPLAAARKGVAPPGRGPFQGQQWGSGRASADQKATREGKNRTSPAGPASQVSFAGTVGGRQSHAAVRGGRGEPLRIPGSSATRARGVTWGQSPSLGLSYLAGLL